jgi:hypothetical protein
VLAQRFLDPAAVHEFALGSSTVDLDDADVAIWLSHEKVTGDASLITEADILEPRDVGLSDLDISAAAARCFFSKTLDVLGAQPDAAFADLDSVLRGAAGEARRSLAWIRFWLPARDRQARPLALCSLDD